MAPNDDAVIIRAGSFVTDCFLDLLYDLFQSVFHFAVPPVGFEPTNDGRFKCPAYANSATRANHSGVTFFFVHYVE
jgi:hypothetical protein